MKTVKIMMFAGASLSVWNDNVFMLQAMACLLCLGSLVTAVCDD